MPTQVQFRRGNTSQHSTFTGASGEITVDTDKNVVVVHDGVTAGGFPLATIGAYDVANAAYELANVAFSIQNVDFTISNSAYDTANAAYQFSNSAYASINSNWEVQNLVYNLANSGYTTLNAAYDAVNSVYSIANTEIAKGFLRLSNSSTTLDGATPNVWSGSFSSSLRDTWSGFYNNNTSTALFTFGSGAGGVMSIQLDGSIFVGDTFTADALGVLPSYSGWIVASSGIKSAYNIYAGADLQAAGNVITGNYVQFADGLLQNTAYKQVVFDTANAAYNLSNSLTTSANSYAGYMVNSSNSYAEHMVNSSNSYAESTYVKLAASSQLINGDIGITGNLTISGNVTYANTRELQVGDNIITLNADLPMDVMPVDNAGIEVNRGIENSNAALLWIESSGQWGFTGNDAQTISTFIASNTFVEQHASSINSHISQIGTAGNNYANYVGISGNSYVSATYATLSNVAIVYNTSNVAFDTANAAFASANNVSPQIAPAYNTANAAYDKANSANVLAYDTGIGANAYADLVGISANIHADVVGASGNAYTMLSTISANIYAGYMANSANIYAYDVGVSGNAYVDAVGLAGNNYTNAVGVAGNAYADYVGTAGNNYASILAANNALAGNNYINAVGVAGNAYADYVGTAGNNYTDAVGLAGNNYASILAANNALAGNNYTDAVGLAGNNYASILAANNAVGANAWANLVGDSANSYAGYVANSANAYATATFIKITSPSQTITGDFTITGNLFIGGNTTSVSANNLVVNDSLIYLANNNVSDTLDIGFVGSYYNATSAHVHTGLVRDHVSKSYYLFQGYDGNPDIANDLLPYSNNMVNATLVADFFTDNLTLGNANAIHTITGAYDTANAAFGSVNTLFIAANSYSDSVGLAGNNYTDHVGFSVNTYTSILAANNAIGANAWANAVSTSGNAYADFVGLSGNNYASILASNNAVGANNWANTKIDSITSNGTRIWANSTVTSGIEVVNIDLSTTGVIEASYGSSTNIPVITVDAYGRVTYAANIAVQGMDYAYANSVGLAGNNYTNSVGLAGNNYINAVGVAGNNYASILAANNALAGNNYTNAVGVAGNNYTNYVGASANAVSATKVATVSGTSGRITSSGTTGITLDLATTAVTPASYGAATSIPVITVDAYGRITSAANVSVQGMDYAYANTIGASANAFADTTYYKKTGGLISGDVAITGNLTISGTTTYANTTQLQVGDNIITLNADLPMSVAPIDNAGIEVNRGNLSSNAALLWIETARQWSISGNTAQTVSTYIASNTLVEQYAVAGNNYTNYVGASANAVSATKVSSVTGTSGRITSSGGTAPTIDLATTAVTPASYGATTSIPVITVDAYGRVTYAANVSVQGMDYAYANTIGASANAWSNTKVSSVTGTAGRITSSGGTAPAIDLATAGAGAATYSSGISAITVDAYGRVTSVTGSAGYGTGTVTSVTGTSGRITSSGGTTPAIDLATSGVAASSYGGATQIPSFVVDAYGRITAAANNAMSGGGASVGDQTTSASTFYPIFSTTTSGTLSVANVSTTKLTFVPSTGTLSSTILNSTSDINKKENIEPIVDAVESINSINGYTFNWKDNGNESIGVIAQEVEKVLPCLVDESGDGKSVNYNGLVAMLIEVVKEQQKEINNIKKSLEGK